MKGIGDGEGENSPLLSRSATLRLLILHGTHKCLQSASLTSGVRVQVKETTRDIKFLHNETFFATAQRKYVYIYDKRGIEVHCLKVSSPAPRLPSVAAVPPF